MTKIFGHRGYKAYYPENTLLSFREAIRQGVDGIELDVHQTKDNKLVLMHDAYLGRVFKGEGKIEEHTLLSLKQSTLNERYRSFSKYHKLWELEKIPTLEEALDVLNETKTPVNIELKTQHHAYDGIESRVLHAVKEHAPKLQVSYSSFHLPTLSRLRALDGDIELGFLVERHMPQLNDYMKTYALDYLHLDYRLLSHDDFQLDVAKEKTRLFTVNHTNTLASFIDEGYDMIITDFPDRVSILRNKKVNATR